MTRQCRWRRIGMTVALTAVLAGCGSDDEAIIGQSDSEEVGTVTLKSDDSTASVEPLCVDDIPEDLTTCPGAPANLGQIELDETRKAIVVVPREVATGGYRLRVNGEPLPELGGVINELNQVVRIPPPAVQAPGETVLTVEALFSTDHPRALWQFLISEPAGPPG